MTLLEAAPLPAAPRAAPARLLVLAAIAALAPRPAAAATLTLGDALVSRAECVARASTEVTLSWDLGSFTADHLQILASSSSGCADSTTTITTAILVDSIDAGQTGWPASGDAAITVTDVLDAAGVAAGTCDGDDQPVYLCVRAITSAGDTAVNASAKLTLQLEVPPPPVLGEVSPGEQALWVSWTAGTAVTGAAASSESYQAFASANGSTVESAATTATTFRLAGLQNLQTYDVWVVAYSSAGNPSAASALGAGTPQHVLDFWESYTSAGGTETGGCGQGGGGALGLLAAAWALARRGLFRRA